MMELKYVIYESGLDDSPKENYIHGGMDPEVVFSGRIANWLGGAEVTTDAILHESEILIGNVNRSETAVALSCLRKNQYGIFCIGNRVAVCGHCTAATVMACKRLLELSPGQLKEGFTEIRTHEEWIVDFPEFSFGTYVGMTDACFEQIGLLYSGTVSGHLAAYEAELRRAGYELEFSNEIEQNQFRRYRKSTHCLCISFTPSDGLTRLISGTGHSHSDAVDWKLDEAVTKVTLTQMTLDYSGGSFGMCYILTLEDGSYLIIDGGHVRVKNGYPKTYDYVRLYTLLKEMNVRADGKILIRAWFMTHEHGDHFNVFDWFCREYGSMVTVERYCACPCSDIVAYNAKNPEFHTSGGRLALLAELVGGMEIVTLHAGDVIELGGLRTEILYTVDDLYPARLHYFNDSSVVFRMTYSGQQILWLGDICEKPSKLLRMRYSAETLKSDIVQLAHHGLNGAEQELYDLIGAKVLLWPLRDLLVDEIPKRDSEEPHRRLAYHLLEEMQVEEVFRHTRNNNTLILPYLPGGERIER